VFLFFSNRLGCLGSLLLSAVATVVLLVALGVIRCADSPRQRTVGIAGTDV